MQEENPKKKQSSSKMLYYVGAIVGVFLGMSFVKYAIKQASGPDIIKSFGGLLLLAGLGCFFLVLGYLILQKKDNTKITKIWVCNTDVFEKLKLSQEDKDKFFKSQSIATILMGIGFIVLPVGMVFLPADKGLFSMVHVILFVVLLACGSVLTLYPNMKLSKLLRLAQTENKK